MNTGEQISSFIITKEKERDENINENKSIK